MGIFGAALRGLGMLGKSGRKASKAGKFLERRVNLRNKKIDDAAKKFKARREVLRGASAKQKLKSDVKKLDKDFKKASKRAEKFSKTLMKQNYSDSAVNKNLTASYKKMRKKD